MEQVPTHPTHNSYNMVINMEEKRILFLVSFLYLASREGGKWESAVDYEQDCVFSSFVLVCPDAEAINLYSSDGK